MRGPARTFEAGLILAGVLLLPGVAAAWPPNRDEVLDYISERAGSVSYTVIGPGGHSFAYRSHREVVAASVIKVMFLVAYLRQPSVRDRSLRQSDEEMLAPMIRRSDNAAATRVANLLGPRPINRLARRAGMDHFRYTRPWGLSTITAGEQAGFMYELERYVPNRHEDYARFLLSHIVRGQRWGIGKLRRPNWRFFFKGGWGSGSGAVCHQVAFLTRENMRIAVAVMITNSPSHDYAKETLRGVFGRLLRDLPKQ
jgi:hypothetical protein